MTVDITLFPFVDLTAQAQVRSGKLTGPNAYVTGGDSVDVGNDLKLSEVWFFTAANPTNATAVHHTEYNYTTDKLQWFDGNTGSEVANGTNLGAFTARFFCTGK